MKKTTIIRNTEGYISTNTHTDIVCKVLTSCSRTTYTNVSRSNVHDIIHIFRCLTVL